jgi:hypothetical protein
MLVVTELFSPLLSVVRAKKPTSSIHNKLSHALSGGWAYRAILSKMAHPKCGIFPHLLAQTSEKSR